MSQGEDVHKLINGFWSNRKVWQRFSTSKFLLRAHGVLVPEQRCMSALLKWKHWVWTEKQLMDLVKNKHSFLHKYSPVSTVNTNISVGDITLNCKEPLDFLNWWWLVLIMSPLPFYKEKKNESSENCLQIFVFSFSSGFFLVYNYFWSVLTGTGLRHNTKQKHSHLFILVRLREITSYGTCSIWLCIENIRRKQSFIGVDRRKAVCEMPALTKIT